MSIIDEYSQFVNSTCWYAHTDERNAGELSYLFHGLTGEAGEAADAFKKIIRDTGFDDEYAFVNALTQPAAYKNLVIEVSDVLWYVTRLCKVLGITLEELMEINTHKLHQRLMEKGILPEDGSAWPFTEVKEQEARNVLYTSED